MISTTTFPYNLFNISVNLSTGENNFTKLPMTTVASRSYPVSTNIQVLLLITSFIALIANILVCISILSVPNLRKSIVHSFVVSLCCTQILVDIVVMPMFCFANHHFLYGYAVALTVMAYITSLLALTFDRYLAVKLPLRYRGLMWYSRSKRIILLSWFISFVVQFIPVLWHRCSSLIFHKIYLSLIAVFFLLIPLCLVIYAYAAILKEIFSLAKRDNDRKVIMQPGTMERKKSETLTTEVFEMESLSLNSLDGFEKFADDSKLTTWYSIKSFSSLTSSNRSSISNSVRTLSLLHYKREIKSALLFVVVGGMYGATWIPVLVMTIFRIFEKEHLIPVEMSVISICIMAGNSLIDPLMYGFYMKDIRQSLIRLFHDYVVRKRNNLNGAAGF